MTWKQSLLLYLAFLTLAFAMVSGCASTQEVCYTDRECALVYGGDGSPR